MKAAVLSAILLASASTATAEDYTIGALSVDYPIAFVTPKTARAGGGYMAITNAGDTDDRLVEIRAEFPRVMIHATEMDGDIAKMVQIDGLDIPAGQTVTLAPGGLHVMFMGLSDPFEAGQDIPAVLVFEHAGELEMTFNVQTRPEAGHEDHSNH